MTYEIILQAMQDEYEELTGTSPDDASDIGIRLKVLASQLAHICRYADEQYMQVFPQTASGKYLDMHAQMRGLERKAAARSSGYLVFSRDKAESFEAAVPEGTLCAVRDEPEIMFATAEAAVIPSGETSVTVPALSCNGGTEANVRPDTVTLMITPPEGVSSVSNALPFTGGEDVESDDMLRWRLMRSMREVPNGANAASYRDAAMKFEGITACSVVPRARGRGTVDVILASGGHAPEDELLEAVSDALEESREIGTDLTVKGVTPVEVDVTVEVELRDGYDQNEAEETCENAVYSFFSALEIGESLDTKALLSSVYAAGAVKSAALTQPSQSYEADYDELLVLGTVSVEVEQ